MSFGDGVAIEVSHKFQRKIDKISPKLHYPTDDMLREIPSEIGPQILIPRTLLYGRQRQEEYEERKTLLALKAFEEDPEGFLDKKPIIACLVPQQDQAARLVVIDGHHRHRESGKVKKLDSVSGLKNPLYDKVPCRVFTVAQMAELFNKSGHLLNGVPYTEESLGIQLAMETGEAAKDFERMPMHKQPHSIEGVTTIEQLQAKFAA